MSSLINPEFVSLPNKKYLRKHYKRDDETPLKSNKFSSVEHKNLLGVDNKINKQINHSLLVSSDIEKYFSFLSDLFSSLASIEKTIYFMIIFYMF